MSFQTHSNFAYGTVTSAPDPAASGTTLVMGTATFAQFPNPGTATTYNAVIWPSGTIPLASNSEIVTISAKGTEGTVTIIREQESSSARTIEVGDQIAMAVTKKTLTDVEDGITLASRSNLLKNGNFINNSTNGYGSTPDDWTSSSANPVQGGIPTLTKQQLIDITGVSDGDIEGLWNLNEASGNALDLSSNGYTLTETSGTIDASSDGLMALARDFEAGDTEWFTIANASCPNLQLTGSKTLIAFVKPESIPAGAGSLVSKIGASPFNGYSLEFPNAGGGVVRVYNSGLSTNTYVDSDVKLEAGKWYMIVGVYDSANSLLKVWVNGVKKQVTASGSNADSGDAFTLGANRDGSGNHYDGLMQNACVLSVALTDAQVKRLWAYTTYKGQKIRRATTDATLSQALNEDLVERLRGKTITLRGQGYCSSTNHGIYITTNGTGGTTTTDTPSSANAWETLSVSVTVPADATTITIGATAPTTDGNSWFKEVALYEGSNALPYQHSPDDWYRFPRLLRMDIPAMVGGKPYQYEENKWYAWTPTYTSSSGTYTTITGTTYYLFSGANCFFNINLQVTNKGTADGAWNMTLPITPTILSGYGGREGGSTGVAIVGLLTLSNISFRKYDAATLWVNNYGIQSNGGYIIA
jgi:hypothetical protein